MPLALRDTLHTLQALACPVGHGHAAGQGSDGVGYPDTF